MPYLNIDDLLTEEVIRSEFGLSTEGIPVTAVQIIDHKPVRYYRESDVIRPEPANGDY